MATLAITNIGTIVSGDINNPVLNGNTILVADGKIQAVGGAGLLDGVKVDQLVDAAGTTVIPGLIDSHAHPVLGDFTPRQKTMDYLDSSVHGGVTSMISAGEPHTPGRPKDPAGTKALAVLAYKSYKNFRPCGLKVHAGALILEKGLQEKDFAELAAEGVWLVGEVGLGSVKAPEEAAPMVQWAKKYGMKVAMHTGGTSIPGSSTVTADMVLKINPTLVSHINGGTTAIPMEEVDRLVDESDLPLEIVQCGNPRVADYVARRLNEKGQLNRIVIGNDSPSGTGIIPLGILRTIVQLSSMSGIPAEKAFAMATGNTARVFELNTSVIAPGREADLVIIDAPLGSVGADALKAVEAGDLPGVSMVVIDGVIRVRVSRNTPPAKRQAEVK
ncbi:MAG: amidohydrolase family protein [Peptococcaceae bacterium]|nr:amidohydrolase family protein [Peptococcaceae bacterium]